MVSTPPFIIGSSSSATSSIQHCNHHFRQPSQLRHAPSRALVLTPDTNVLLLLLLSSGEPDISELSRLPWLKPSFVYQTTIDSCKPPSAPLPSTIRQTAAPPLNQFNPSSPVVHPYLNSTTNIRPPSGRPSPPEFSRLQPTSITSLLTSVSQQQPSAIEATCKFSFTTRSHHQQ